MRSPKAWIVLCAMALVVWLIMIGLIVKSIDRLHIDEGARGEGPRT